MKVDEVRRGSKYTAGLLAASERDKAVLQNAPVVAEGTFDSSGFTV